MKSEALKNCLKNLQEDHKNMEKEYFSAKDRMKEVLLRTQINLNKLENALNKNLSFIKKIDVKIREIIDPGIKRMNRIRKIVKLLSIGSLFTSLGLAYYVFKHGNLIKTFLNAFLSKIQRIDPKNVVATGAVLLSLTKIKSKQKRSG